MASVTTATSEWIQFFKDAGIPAGLAVTYAVSFVDNRINKNMLMDLSKDIMIDLGITVIGDIIAILKHAKQVYRQDMCKMATEAISSGQTSVKAELRRTANTPATRMIANALSHDSPPATPARRPDNRLSVTVSNMQGKGSKAVVSQPADEGNGVHAVKRRRVTAEMEGVKRTSVFARLGAESKADTTTGSNKPTGVFSRLDRGNEEHRLGKMPGNMEVEEEDDSDGEGSVLQYAGVLKRAPPSQKKEPATKPAPTTLRRLGGKFKLPPSDTPTSSSSSSPSPNGLPPVKISVLQRLGKIPATHPSTAVSPTPADTQDNRVTSSRPRAQERLTIASPKVSSSTSAAGGDACGAQMDVRAISVFKRLGSKRT
ncbi:uncharacterized protein C19orf47 homolog isoform X2 [Notolabrus celidotus]|uniref:uncharacterized protein C19orf47 homolog isoform X2 n=1 Tax=Notolabrus celidotus TaxID=1203425 RepID=UPI0014900193|nr:uncharacterized protein C19orf47 homolog isoform X2 [Notolabrus celidotus]